MITNGQVSSNLVTLVKKLRANQVNRDQQANPKYKTVFAGFSIRDVTVRWDRAGLPDFSM
jgi:hypothetical protein